MLFLLTKIDVTQIIAILITTDLWYLAFAFLFYLPMILIKAWRWNVLMKLQEIKYSLKEAFTMYLVGIYIGLATPGKIGDFIKVIYLHKDGYDTGRALFNVFADRLFDVAALFSIGYISMLIFGERFFSALIFFTALLLLLMVILWQRKLAISIIKGMFAKTVGGNFKDSNAEASFNNFTGDFHLLKSRKAGVLILATAIAYALDYIQMYLLALSLGIKISFLYLVLCISLVGLVTLLPVSIFGIGTRDAVLVILFALAGISSEAAIAYSSLILFLQVALGVICAIAWLKKPVEVGQ